LFTLPETDRARRTIVRLGKIVGILFCGGVLPLQAHAIFSTMGYNNHYWPFVNYPMYSNPYRVGESFSVAELRAVPCDNPRDTFLLGEDDLHLKWVHFHGLVHSIADAPRADVANEPHPRIESAAKTLLHFITKYVPRPVCRVQVWRQRYTIGPRGLQYPGQPWEIAHELIPTPRTLGASSPESVGRTP
jgi:hypothetical protein